jgi:hypothetical protein
MLVDVIHELQVFIRQLIMPETFRLEIILLEGGNFLIRVLCQESAGLTDGPWNVSRHLNLNAMSDSCGKATDEQNQS